MELSLAVSILAVVITVVNFVLSRKDKAVKESSEESSSQKLIEYRLNELTKKVDKILEKLDRYDIEIKNIVQEEMEKHILEYHK